MQGVIKGLSGSSSSSKHILQFLPDSGIVSNIGALRPPLTAFCCPTTAPFANEIGGSFSYSVFTLFWKLLSPPPYDIEPSLVTSTLGEISRCEGMSCKEISSYD